MILIFSSKEDYSTNEVIKWLKYYNQPFLRLNSIDIYKLEHRITLSNNEFKFRISGTEYNINDFSAIWYRRGGFYYSLPKNLSNNGESVTIKKHIANENISLIEYLKNQFDKKPKLGSLRNYTLNKLNSLEIAKQIGLKIPDTLITTRKSDLVSFLYKHNELITKNIKDVLIIENNDNLCFSYTELVTKKFVNDLPLTFPPSFFQEKINKKFEVRSFYLDGEFYSMVIFSQNDAQTDVDFRKYNYDNPNRVCKFKLPKEIETKLKDFMQQINLNTGSFDLIYSVKNEFVFLELNPIGQYDALNKSCAYDLDKKIAQHLIKLSKNGIK